MTFLRRSLIGGLLAATFSLTAQAQQAITLHGASQFGDDHAFTKTMVSRSITASRSTSCCTKTASLAWRKTTLPI